MIEPISPSEILRNCRKTLRLDTEQKGIDDTLICALLRRIAGTMCPCTRAELRNTLLESLEHLKKNEETSEDNDFKSKLDSMIDRLLTIGDLHEYEDVTDDDSGISRKLIFSAPPGFVLRSNGNAILLGVVPEIDSFLPPELEKQITHQDGLRFIEPIPESKLKNSLPTFGLVELSEEEWLKSPKKNSANELIERYENNLNSQNPTSSIDDLKIIENSEDVKYYRGRWTTPSNQSGMYIGRRPQEYGADFWCIVLLEGGKPIRLLDFPTNDFHWRGCDEAWYLQMAIDRQRSTPQIVSTEETNGGVRFDFYSPIPSWAERRMVLFGESKKVSGCLMSFEISEAESDQEIRWLCSNLWLERN